MCVLVVGFNASERYPLVLAANRDEQHRRPTAAAAWWSDLEHVLGGRDLAERGTWLAIDRHGRLAAVTNVREPAPAEASRSRGSLVAGYLAEPERTASYLDRLEPERDEYRPFSLLLYDRNELHYYSNRAPRAVLAPGIHALSNAPLGVEWPKTRAAIDGMRAALAVDDPGTALFELLGRREPSLALEAYYRASLFIEGPVYGTRSSTVIVIDVDGEVAFTERSFDADSKVTGEVRERFRLPVGAHGVGPRALRKRR